jgi:DMSO/TMAO reductase YedYZ heme-binding membrane subunit
MIRAPSFLAHIGNALLLLVAVVLFFKNYASIKNANGTTLLALALLASIAIGIHGLSHLGLERVYNYNPFFLYR